MQRDNEYLTAEAYATLISANETWARVVLRSFEHPASAKRDVTIRNFVARSMTCLRSIWTLWQLRSFHDCWTLHRSLLDRLFHLHALNEDNAFEVFEKWSFVKRIEARSNALSDLDMLKMLRTKLYPINKVDQRRYAKLKTEGLRWTRPKPEVEAKRMHLPFLYKLAYDYASTYVHPMADDGEDDYLWLTQIGQRLPQDHIVVVHNSVFVHLLLSQLGLNASSLQWRALLYDFLDQCKVCLGTGKTEYLQSLDKMLAVPTGFAWCSPPAKTDLT